MSSRLRPVHKLLGLALNKRGVCAGIIALSEIVAVLELLEHLAALTRRSSQVYRPLVLQLTHILQLHMRLLHPFLVYLLFFLTLFSLLLSDLSAALISLLLDDLAVPVDLHEHMSSLIRVPLHHRLPLRVHHRVVVRHQVQRHILQELTLILAPQRRSVHLAS